MSRIVNNYLVVKKILYVLPNNRLQLTAGMVSDLFSLRFSLRPAAPEPER